MIQRPTLPDLGLIERHFQRLQRALAPGVQNDNLVSNLQTVDVKEPLLDLSLRLTTEFLLGEDMDSMVSTMHQTKWTDRFAIEFNTAFSWIAKRERLKAFHWMIDSLAFRRSCSTAQSLVDEAVKHSVEVRQKGTSTAESYVALESLLRADRDTKATRDQFMNLLLAGRDTSGALLCWVFYALAREPALSDELRKEIQDTLGSDDKMRTPTKSELNAMTKLDQFICESE